ncbi:MAG: transcriptional repressor [Pseudomonadota bacterium]
MQKRTLAAAELPKKWRRIAETRCAEQGERLTPARLGAYAELIAERSPMTAYQLVARLEAVQGRKVAPLTVYRHLDFLKRVGLVHRIESTQSYVPCEHPDHAHESQYLLCSSCGQVDEIDSKALANLLKSLADEHKFTCTRAIVELSGVCRQCARSAAKSS